MLGEEDLDEWLIILASGDGIAGQVKPMNVVQEVGRLLINRLSEAVSIGKRLSCCC